VCTSRAPIGLLLCPRVTSVTVSLLLLAAAAAAGAAAPAAALWRCGGVAAHDSLPAHLNGMPLMMAWHGEAWRGAVQCGVTRSWGLFADEGRSGWRAPRSRCCVFAVRVRPSSVSPPAGWVGGTTPGARQGNTAASQIKWPWFALPFCGWTQPLVAVARAKSIRGVRLGATGGPDGATPAGMASPPPLSTVPDASLIASQRTLFLGGLSWVTT
jgi:hypothetical protein